MRSEIILLSKVENLGELGALVKVRSGYARNYLIPYGKAKLATPENIEEFRLHKERLEGVVSDALQQAERRKQKIDGLDFEVTVKVSDEGTLFGSVGITEIINAVKENCGEEIERNEVYLPGGPFRELGEHQVSFRFHPGVSASVKLRVIAES